MPFDTIVLVTGGGESGILSALLLGHNPALNIHVAPTLEALDALPESIWPRARLLSFVSGLIVPARLLERCAYGAYNFHPGPPEYPGWAPAHFAIYHRASTFGVTAHVMHERVDAGPIIGAMHFAIPARTTVPQLEELAFKQLAKLFWHFAAPMATQSKPLDELPLRWAERRSTRRSVAAICDLSTDITPQELAQRVLAFGAGHSGTELTVSLHGHRFRYVRDEAVDARQHDHA